MLNKEVVGRVAGVFNALNKDARISRRLIIRTALSKAKFIISQKVDMLTMNRDYSLVKTLPCVRLEKVPAKDCGIVELKRCTNLMKSVCKLPEVLFTKTGPFILAVTNIDGSKEYEYITLNKYRSRGKRQYLRENKTFFTISDGYLYLIDSTNELVEIDMPIFDTLAAQVCSECMDEDCTSYWDTEFPCPERLIDVVLESTRSELAMKLQIPEDENGDLDSNQKSKTVN